MQNEKTNIQEVAQPLSQGEKNFKAMHKVALNKSVVPGVTDQEHVFKGNPRKMDQPTASREIYKSEDESKENYDKGLKRKEDYYATEEVVDEASLSAKDARAGKDIGAPGKNFSKIADSAAKRYGSKAAGERVAGAILKKMRANEEVEQVEEEIVEPIIEKKASLKGYKAKLDAVGKEDADIDNDGDTDKSDEYLHNRRKAIKAAMKEEAEETDEAYSKNWTSAHRQDTDHRHKKPSMKPYTSKGTPSKAQNRASLSSTPGFKEVLAKKGLKEDIKSNKEANANDYISKNAKFANQSTSAVNKMVSHDCAKHVAHEEWGFGICIPECHTIVETTEGEGYVTHYDIEFTHGIELNVPVETLKILVSENHSHTARKSMKEDYDMDVDYEGEMAKAELRAICDKADKLANMMTDDMQLEAWLQSKISRAKDYIDAVHDYLIYRGDSNKKSEDMPAVPMATQAPMGTNYASFLTRMGEETQIIGKAKKAFESKLIEMGLVTKPKDTIDETIQVTEEEQVLLSDEETARIKEILEKE